MWNVPKAHWTYIHRFPADWEMEKKSSLWDWLASCFSGLWRGGCDTLASGLWNDQSTEVSEQSQQAQAIDFERFAIIFDKVPHNRSVDLSMVNMPTWCQCLSAHGAEENLPRKKIACGNNYVGLLPVPRCLLFTRHSCNVYQVFRHLQSLVHKMKKKMSTAKLATFFSSEYSYGRKYVDRLSLSWQPTKKFWVGWVSGPTLEIPY